MYHDATAPNGRQHEAFLRFLVKLCRRLTVKRAPSSVSAHLMVKKRLVNRVRRDRVVAELAESFISDQIFILQLRCAGVTDHS